MGLILVQDNKAKAAGVFVALALVLLVAYSFGLSGIFFIDDAPSLDGMQGVHDGLSALAYITSGNAGPLGRPLSLASFLLQVGAYPRSAMPFLLVNSFIHVSNVLLLALVLRCMQRLLPSLLGNSRWLAPLAAFFWGVLPILASTSLMVVQRMTSLCALFVLLGMLFYLWVRAQTTLRGVALGIAGIGVCTLLAALSKENGVLLPLLLLVLHGTLFACRAGAVPVPVAQRWLLAALWLPSLAVLGYLCLQIPTIADTYWNRPFTLWQRLATEPVILWDYLRVAFAPSLHSLSPFRDDYPVYQFSDSASMLALAAWAALLLVATGLWWHGRPLLAFAALWFLVGHLLESSIFALFLYFEHRNYVPLIGPVLVLSVWVTRLPVAATFKRMAVGLYLAFLAVMLWQTTSMWGERQQLIWAKQHPDSARALQMLAGSYMQAGKVKEVVAMYDVALQRNPQFASIAVQGLRASCYLQDDGIATRYWLDRAQRTLPVGEMSLLTITSLGSVANLQMQGHCNALAAEDVLELVDALERNPVYRGADSRSQLHVVRANVALGAGDVDSAAAQMREVLRIQPDMETIKTLYQLLQKAKGQAAAQAFLREAKALRSPEKSVFAQREWQRNLETVGAP